MTIRGSVVGFGGGAIGQTLNTTSYPWIATSANNGSLWYNGTPRPSQTGANYRKVRIQISPAPNPVVNVWIAFGYNSPLVYTPMITNQALPAISTSQQLMIGYAASTGGSTNYHEIRNLLVSNQATATAIDLAITKTFADITTGSTTTASAGDQIRYTVIASNTGPNNVTATGVGIQDNVPAAITGVTWTCAGSGGATCGAASGSGNNINTIASFPLNGYVTYTITGTVSVPAPSLLSNTASLVIPGSITDYNSANNNATSSIPVTSDLSTSTKTWTDLNGGDQNPGDVIPYTITLNETAGAAASGVSVTDTFPATLTNLSVTSCPSGATCNIAGQVLTVSNASVSANGTAAIVVSTTIAGGTAIGTLINNTATITNPAGLGATPAAPTITVSQSQSPATGNKPLYLYDSTSTPAYKLSRTPMTPNAGSYVAIAKGGGVQTWTLNPFLQSSVKINNGNIPVNLYLATNSARSYTPQIDLLCGAAVVATENSQAVALTGGVQFFPFTLTLAAAYNCVAPAWTLRITNTMTGGAGARDIRVYPAPALSQYSNVSLPSQNVINVDSVNAYSAAYPATTTPPSGYYSGGNTVYVRAVVSDPFGSYDIDANTPTTLPKITIKDPSGVTIVPASGPPPAMTEKVAARTASSKTFEYTYTIPASGPTGIWTASVTAPEGTEGLVSHTANGTFRVVLLPSLTVVKSVQTLSDPVNGTTNPKAIPGAVMLYTVQVTNSSYGSVDNNTTVITDLIPANTSMCVSTLCSNPPLAFTCSASPACGLTFNYLTDVTYTCASPPAPCPQADASGYGANVTSITIKPSGTFNGAPSPQSTNFSVTFKTKIN